MSQFQVDSAQVASASAAASATAQQIGVEADRLMRQLLDLQSGWQGQASSSFQAVIARWRGTQEQVRSALEEIQHALAATGRGYEEAEAAALRMFSS